MLVILLLWLATAIQFLSFVNELIDNDYYQQIDDLNNSNLYIVSICGSNVTHELIKVD